MPFVSIFNLLVAGVQVVKLGTDFARTQFDALLIGPPGLGRLGVWIAFQGNFAGHVCRDLGKSGPRVIFGESSQEKVKKIQPVGRLGPLLLWLGLRVNALLVWPIGRG